MARKRDCLGRKVQAVFCGFLIVLVGLGALVPNILAERQVWSIEIVDSTGVGRYTSLTLDTVGYPHISYFDGTNDDLKYAYKDSSGWHTNTVDYIGYVGRYTSLALDSNDYPHISYYDVTNGDLKYAYQDSGGWHITTVDSIGNVGMWASLALDNSDYPHISYHHYGANGDLKYAYQDSGGWHITTVDSIGNVGACTSLALGNSDYPHISYHDITNVDLKYAYQDSGGWHTSTVDSIGDVGESTSLALDSNDYPHISYRDYVPNLDLKYTYKDSTGWHTTTVDSTGNVGTDTSIALDSNDYPHISYHDVANVDLKYAYQDSGGWHTTTVDSTGNVGSHTSLALDSNDYPHISYYKASNYNLKYAYQDSFPPVITNIANFPDPQKTGGYVNISCDVSDNVAVNVVKVNIIYPDNSIVNMTMNQGSYYYNTTYTQPGVYQYFIWANDTSGNSNVSQVYSFEIINLGEYLYAIRADYGNCFRSTDGGTTWSFRGNPGTGPTGPDFVGITSDIWPHLDISPPEITNVSDFPDPQYTGKSVNITCKVTDNVAVNTVIVNITLPDTTAINMTMTPGSYYYNNTYAQPGLYQYFIWANDTSGNYNKSAIYNFTIIGYTLNINTVGNGNVTKNPDQTTYTYGTTVTLTAAPDTGWTFSHWAGDLTGSTNPDTITMTGNKTVTATFTQDQYTLTINTVGSGNVNKNPDQSTYTYGTTVTLTAAPDTGWSFIQWSGDLTGSINPDTITMTGDKTVTAIFTQDQYTLTINIMGSGTVTKNPDQATYTYGTTVTLTAIPDTDWNFSHWSGDLMGSGNPGTITMTGHKIVTAAFNELILDYIRITYKSGNEIPDQNISTGFNLTGYAQAIYENLDFISVNWSVTNSGSSASTSPLMGPSSTFFSGLVDGTALWTIDDGNGHSDTVEFIINSSLYSMMFYQGWNLVTIPFDNGWTAETMGENISGCTVVSMFDASTQTFLTHVVGVPHDNFPIVDGVGYFVYVDSESIFSLQDVPISSVTVPIYEDWNVIGWYHDYFTTAESLGENISGTTVVTMFDPVTQTFITHVVGVPHDNFAIEQGMGLFIYTTEASIWHGEG